MIATHFNVTSPAPREVWHALMKRDPEALPYQMPGWLDSICALGKYEDVSRFYEAADGRQFILPLVRRRLMPSIVTTAASLPHGWGMGGVVASGNIGVEDVQAIFADLARLPFGRIVVRPNPRMGPLWAAAAPHSVTAAPRLAHVLDLGGGFDHVWSKRFSKNTRSRVRKAERLGVVVECDTTGRLIPVFYDLLLRSFDRWAERQHEPRLLTRLRGAVRDPLRKFQMIAENLGQACRVWVAWVDGQPAAAAVVLQNANVNDARAAMNKELAATGASDLILKLSIEDACRSGCRYYHMGESGRSASLAHFKSRFGAEPYSYAEYYMEKLPITRVDAGLRRIVKLAIGFKDE